MADNVSITPGSGAAVRTKDKGGVETPVSLLDVGGAGAEALLSPASPMPAAPTLGGLYGASGALAPLSAFADVTAAGDTPIVAGVAGKRVTVLGYAIGPASGATDCYFKSSGGAQLCSTKRLAAGGGVGRSDGALRKFQTATGEGLTFHQSAAAAVGVDVEYVLE